MEIVRGPKLDEFVLDETANEFFQKIENADYVLYRQNGAEWKDVPNGKVRSVVGKKRVKGLLHHTTFEARFTEGEFRSNDNFTVRGSVAVWYDVLNPDTLLNSSIGLSVRLLSRLSAALSAVILQYTSRELRRETNAIIAQTNRDLGALQSEMGVELRIERLTLETGIEREEEENALLRVRLEGELGRRLIEAETNTRITSEASRAQAEDVVYAATILLPVQRQQAALEADRMRAIRQIDVDMQRQEIDNSLYRMRAILGPNISPRQYLEAIALVDSKAADSIAQIMMAQGMVTRDQLASRYLESRLPSMSSRAMPEQQFTDISGEITSGQPPQPPLLTIIDPVESAIREQYSDCQSVRREPTDSGKVRYVVIFDRLSIAFILDNRTVSAVYYGFGNTPEIRWPRDNARGSSPEQIAVTQIEIIRNFLKR